SRWRWCLPAAWATRATCPRDWGQERTSSRPTRVSSTAGRRGRGDSCEAAGAPVVADGGGGSAGGPGRSRGSGGVFAALDERLRHAQATDLHRAHDRVEVRSPLEGVLPELRLETAPQE